MDSSHDTHPNLTPVCPPPVQFITTTIPVAHNSDTKLTVQETKYLTEIHLSVFTCITLTLDIQPKELIYILLIKENLTFRR